MGATTGNPCPGGEDGMRWQLVSAQLPPVALVAFR
jgi:hypothetical protein